MLSLSDNNQTDVIEAFNSISSYLDDLLDIDNPYFEQMVSQIYPTKLQLYKRIALILKPPFGLRLVHNKWHKIISKDLEQSPIQSVKILTSCG